MEKDNQDSEKFEDIRVDLYKLNEKVFAQYPIGSPERENLIRARKVGELKQVMNALDSVPHEQVAMAKTLNRHLMAFALARAFLAAGFLSFSLFLMRYVHDIISILGLGLFGLVSLAYVFYQVRLAVEFFVTTKELKDSYDKLNQRLFDLLGDLGNLGKGHK